MVYLDDLVNILNVDRGRMWAIVNKPYAYDHILYMYGDRQYQSRDLDRLLNFIGSSEVIEIRPNVTIQGGKNSCTMIYVDIPSGIFDNRNDEETYGSGFIDFYDIEQGTYDREMYFTYKDMYFYMPGNGLKVPK